MKYAIISDIHGNFEALKAVLKGIEKTGADKFICLGDIIGYGADIHECISEVQRIGAVTVPGNHEYAVLGKIDYRLFRNDVWPVWNWTRKNLTDSELSFLQGLPEKKRLENFTIVHGSPRDPVLEYIDSPEIASDNFALISTKVCFVGHTHIPGVYFLDNEGKVQHRYFNVPEFDLAQTAKAIVNAGSVGQPRDKDPRAGYLIFDSETNTVTDHRVKYDVRKEQKRMQKLDVPEFFIQRLSLGV
jgi:diadenosine tetraphosphatase ApaH/serine/threonine PP2A family protein phosphatase